MDMPRFMGVMYLMSTLKYNIGTLYQYNHTVALLNKFICYNAIHWTVPQRAGVYSAAFPIKYYHFLYFVISW